MYVCVCLCVCYVWLDIQEGHLAFLRIPLWQSPMMSNVEIICSDHVKQKTETVSVVVVVEVVVAWCWLYALLKMHTIQVFLMDGSSRQLSLVSHSSTTVQQLHLQMMRVCAAFVSSCLDLLRGGIC